MKQLLILASQSPRRRQLLAQLGYSFSCQPADIDETVIVGELPEQYVRRLALQKAQCIADRQQSNSTVIGSDTSVVIAQQILGKPKDFADAQRLLQLLSGKVHQVLTAVAVVKAEISKTVLVTTNVEFKTLSTDEIQQYWLTGEPKDKAGGYGIQGTGGQFVKQISGSYSAVVGLPLYETAQLLTEFGLPSAINSATVNKD